MSHSPSPPRPGWRAQLSIPRATAERAVLLARYERWSDIPLIVLALLIIPLLLAPLLLPLEPAMEMALEVADWLIWACFALDLCIRTYLAPRRLAYLRSHWYDVLIVALPLLRPLRLARSARLLMLLRGARLAVVLLRFASAGRRVITAHDLHLVLAGMVVLIAASGALVAHVERGGDGPIQSFGDGLWFAITTVTTVGYGDLYPRTPEGRGVAFLLMLLGITLFGILTANIAAYFVQSSSREDELRAKLDEVLERLKRLEEKAER